MKILITTFTYTPNKDGVAEACRTMAEGLAELGWDVWVATSTGNPNLSPGKQPILREGVKIVEFPLGHHRIKSPELVPEIENYRNFVRQGNFEIIVNQCWDARMTRFLQPIRNTLNAKFVMVSHGYGAHQYHWHPGWTLGIGRWLRGLEFTFREFPKMIRACDRLIFLSQQKDFGRFFDHKMASWMHHDGIEIVENGINLDNVSASRAAEFRQRHGIGDALMVLCVANYSERKNQRLAVESFRRAGVPGSVLICIGSEINEYGKSVVELNHKLEASSPECRVILLEKLERSETFAAFNACDLFLLTAKAETQPIVLIEAMAAGKPWVSTATGCVPSMAGGIVCHRKSELSPAIQTLLGDKNLRNQLGQQGLVEARERHDAAVNIRRYDEIFHDLAGKPSSLSTVA